MAMSTTEQPGKSVDVTYLEWLEEHVTALLRTTEIERLGGEWYASIPSCPGVWATGDTRSEAETVLESVLRGWLGLQLFGEHEPLQSFD